MKIGILGGTFDPIHCGHLQLAQNARVQFSLDKVIFVPAYQPPHKKELTSLTPAADRYEMVRLAVEGEPYFEVSDCELKRKGISYTCDTLDEFKKRYPNSAFFLILGKDAFESIDTWHRAADLKRMAGFLVGQRGKGKISLSEGARVERIEMPLCPVSASGLREAIRQGRNVTELVPPKVLEFIKRHALYGRVRS